MLKHAIKVANILGRNKSSILGYLKDKVVAQIRTWDAKTKSRAGKEIMVRSVAQSLPAFPMNVFLLPLDITKDIERTLSKFWWKSSQSSNSDLCWMSWDKMARHKSTCGLVFKNFRDFNLAMLGKQAWRYLCSLPVW